MAHREGLPVTKEDRMSRSLRATLPALILLAVAACTDTPLGLTADDTLSAPAPEFLIGNSPLFIRIVPPGQGQLPGVEVTVEVTRGLTEVKIEDKFKVRMTVEFSNGTVLGTVGPQDQSLVGVKDDGLRQGALVEIAGCIDIPAPLWDDLVAAGTVEVKATVELVMTDGAGKEHILDTKSTAIIMDID
jgi:hypothetical protein